MATPHLFFLDRGPEGQRLCVHHAAQGIPRGRLLLLHAFGEEMNKSRHMLAQLARQAAQAGLEVLQIDLKGCGDSSGDFGDASWQDWVDDARIAQDWLLTRGNLAVDAPLWLMGHRAGALLATALARQDGPPCRLLLWHPLASGKLQLQQFLRLRLGADLVGGQAKGAMQALREQLAAGQTVEVAGYALSPAMAHGLEAADLKPAAEPARVRQLVWLELGTADAGLSPAAQLQLQPWQAAGVPTQAHCVEGPAFWATSEIAQAPALLQASLAALLAPQEELA